MLKSIKKFKIINYKPRLGFEKVQLEGLNNLLSLRV